MAPQVLYGLAGAALAVLFRVGEPVQARQVGDGLELLAGEEPLGQVRGDGGRGCGDEAVLGVDGDVEVVGQKAILSARAIGAPRMTGVWREVPGGR
ncbi:hypothetical protein ACFWBX_11735 [Streptomyces sp. NPDC059991]|uniref:hypothetical protein n=1 Tax=Streptomyces sp. NPDC059991 TaxID=3347028 RepID=UPI0036B06C9C